MRRDLPFHALSLTPDGVESGLDFMPDDAMVRRAIQVVVP
jgi:hypothetical protein